MNLTHVKPKLIFSKIGLLAVLIVPLLLTISLTSRPVNYWSAILQLVFVLIMLPETISELKKMYLGSNIFKLLIMSFSCLYLGWIWNALPLLKIDRSWHYPVYLLFFLAMTSWFKLYGKSGFFFILKIKIAAIVFAMAYLLFYILVILPPSNYMDAHILTNPPIYRNIRHMNYDMALAIGLILFCFCAEKGLKNNILLLLLFACGLFTVWSAGRGQMLSLMIFIALLFYFQIAQTQIKKIYLAITALLLGGLSTFITGDTFFLVTKAINSQTADPLNELSTGRIALWQQAITMLHQHNGWLIGFGPDAWLRLKGWTLHPHNFIIQWLFEFGVPVTLVLLAIAFKGVICWIKTLKNAKEFGLDQTIAALLLSTFCYALLDGHFYHAIPLTMILIMSAYLYAQVPIQ